MKRSEVNRRGWSNGTSLLPETTLLAGAGPIQPDTARGKGMPTGARQAMDRGRLERQGNLQREGVR